MHSGRLIIQHGLFGLQVRNGERSTRRTASAKGNHLSGNPYSAHDQQVAVWSESFPQPLKLMVLTLCVTKPYSVYFFLLFPPQVRGQSNSSPGDCCITGCCRMVLVQNTFSLQLFPRFHPIKAFTALKCWFASKGATICSFYVFSIIWIVCIIILCWLCCTSDINCTSVRPGRGIPPQFLFPRFLYFIHK